MNKLEDIILFQIDKTSKLSKMYSQREFDKVKFGLTIDQWVLLKIIEAYEPLSQKELATKSSRDPASITRTLDLLQKKEYVIREKIVGNRRQYNIRLTSLAKKFITKHMEKVNKHRMKSIEGFSEKELKQLSGFLTRIQKNMG